MGRGERLENCLTPERKKRRCQSWRVYEERKSVKPSVYQNKASNSSYNSQLHGEENATTNYFAN